MDKTRYKIIATVTSVAVYLSILFFALDFAGVMRYAVQSKKSSEEIVIDITEPEIKPTETASVKVPVESAISQKQAPKSVKSLFSDTNTSDDLNELFKDKVIVKTRTKQKKISVDELFDSSVAKKSQTKSIMERIDAGDRSGASVVATEGERNAYFDLIHETISRGWNPLPSQKGMVVALVIKVETTGKFEFYVKSSTGDREFLEMLKKHMRELQANGLPKPGKRTTVQINFIAKE
jgi:hypothetical protein